MEKIRRERNIMTKLAREIWKFLDIHPCIRMNMSLGLINIRALARHVINHEKIDATLDAVMSAIKRYDLKTSKEMVENALKIISKSITISTKSPLANISIAKDIEVQNLLPQIFSLINYNRGDTLRIIQANESIKILVDEKNLEKVKSIFPEKKILGIDRNLAEINIHMHSDAENTPGIMAVIANELAINGINVLESMSSISEMLWFVDEKDLLKTYNALNRLWQLKLKPLQEIKQDT